MICFKFNVCLCVGLTSIVLVYNNIFSGLAVASLYVAAILSGIYVGLKIVFLKDESYKAVIKRNEPCKHLLRLIQQRCKDDIGAIKTKTVFTRNVDACISEMIDLTLRDCVMNWYADLVDQPEKILPVLKENIWIVINNIKGRLENFDEVKFMTNTAANRVNEHFKTLRLVLSGKYKTFELSPHLASIPKELDYLRNLSEFFLIILLPTSYARCIPIRQLLREILACSVLNNVIDMISDPDYINQKLLDYLDHQARRFEEHNRTYMYAASYEDFIQIISKCTVVEDLKQMRYKIMTEIMHATTINNLKKAKGMHADKEFNPQGTDKADLLEARHLPRYINQLTFAKAQCEKRIRMFGGPDYSSPTEPSDPSNGDDSHNMPGKKILSLSVILDNSHARQYLLLFLKQKDVQSLLEFWRDVNVMKNVDRSERHSLGNEIFNNYINNSNSIIRLSKSILKGMEAFMMADKGPDAFFEAQEEVYVQLEQKYYPSFIVSDVYHRMITDAEYCGIDFLKMQSSSSDDMDATMALSSECILFSDHSSYAKSKLLQLSDRITDKVNALNAVALNTKKDHMIIQKIAGEIQAMKQERDKISEHIDRTEIWSENLGNWAATIYSVLEYLEDDKIVPYFFIVVHPFGESYKTVLTGGESIGWIVSRKFQDFHLIHSKLLPAAPWVKKVDLPTQSKWFRFLNSGEQLEKAKLQLQVFLSKIMEDDQLNKSEALYSFLSPSPGYLKTVCISNEKRRFSLTSLFKSNSDMAEGASKDEYVFLDDFDFKDDRKDSIAESLYSLIGEVFELHGVFKWLRKSLIVFVQVTFGQTINRQIRDTVSWFFSESMLLFYINTFKDSMWPDGKMAPAWPARSDESKQQTRIQAKAQVLSNIPGVLVNLVGQQNADRGVNKMFEAMQDKRLNKQLIYNLIEDFVKQFGPELKDFSTHRL